MNRRPSSTEENEGLVSGIQTNRTGRKGAKREFAQLQRIQEHLSRQFELMRDELEAPVLQNLLREIRRRSTSVAPDSFQELTALIEGALRTLKVVDAEIRAELEDEVRELRVEGISNLPPRLARFIAERREIEGFTYEITQDRLRGWVIRWKEYGADGRIRGAGQFAERPYAWLDD